jgi:hypothetical protein
MTAISRRSGVDPRSIPGCPSRTQHRRLAVMIACSAAPPGTVMRTRSARVNMWRTVQSAGMN